MSSFWKNNERPFSNRTIKVQGEPYLALVDALPPEYGKKLYLGIAVPETLFTTPLRTVGAQTAFISLAMLLLFSPCIYLAARGISRPLQALSRRTADLALLKLDRSVTISTRIVEIRTLARALENLRKQLKTYANYLPGPIINKLIANDIPPILGGVRKELSIFYSAINEFNQLSESMSPEQVTNSLSGYFQTLNEILYTHGGTMEKYSGDMIVSFWNAPKDDPKHALRCCLAALQSKEKLRIFNQQRNELGLPAFLTRIGIHTGQTLVGNIGFSGQMDYTAMGTSCVLANRIERLNKFLGTTILASEATKKAVGDALLFRFAGRILSPGTDAPARTNVYELLGAPPDAQGPLAPYALPSETTKQTAQWEAAAALFLAKDFSGAAVACSAFLTAHGSDPLAQSYLAQAQHYLEQPPNTDWEGEWFLDAR